MEVFTMALLKKFQFPNGTETNYHKIGEMKLVPLPDTVIYIPIEPVEPVEEEVSEGTIIVETPDEVTEEPTTPEDPVEPETPEDPEEPIDPEEPVDPELPEEPEAPEYQEVVVKNYSVVVQLLSYVSQEVREHGVDNHLNSKLYYFNVTLEQLTSTDILKLGYHLIKTLPEFEDAENV
jgi:hypothetical protein